MRSDRDNKGQRGASDRPKAPASRPRPGAGKPPVTGSRPRFVTRKPGTVGSRPGSPVSRPGTVFRKPNTIGSRLSTGSRPSTAGPRPFTTGSRPAAPGNRSRPLFSAKRPGTASGNRPGAASGNRPDAGSRPGTVSAVPGNKPASPKFNPPVRMPSVSRKPLAAKHSPTQSSPPRRPPRFQRPAPPQTIAGASLSGERLQKVLAHAGVASRRAAEEMIAAGRVTVNGEIVKEMGVRVQPTDVLQVDSKRLNVPPPTQAAQELLYIAINKPLGVVSTSKDPQGRTTVLDVLRRQGSADDARKEQASQPPGTKITNQRVYPIGRLDVDSTGLLLLTNDGDLTFRITHPRYGIEKEYRVLVRGRPGAEPIQKLRDGVEIEGGLTAPAKVEHLTTVNGNTWLRVTIHEGRKRQVRLMVAAVGHPVIELQRTRVGPIALGELEPGRWRYLALHEVHALRKAVGLNASTHGR